MYCQEAARAALFRRVEHFDFADPDGIAFQFAGQVDRMTSMGPQVSVVIRQLATRFLD
jgi:hypothetical protein